jgi:hypothetical protein
MEELARKALMLLAHATVIQGCGASLFFFMLTSLEGGGGGQVLPTSL